MKRFLAYSLALVLGSGIAYAQGPVRRDDLSRGVVERVIDGDTIEVSGERVRFPSINTMEKWASDDFERCMAYRATDALTDLLLGHEVRLESDRTNRDDYHRLLRHVYLGGISVSEYMVRHGFAEVREYEKGMKHLRELRKAEAYAKLYRLGIWGDECSEAAD